MPSEDSPTRRPAGSLQAALEEVFPSQQSLKSEPTSGIITLVVFCLLLGTPNINSIGEVAKGCRPDWRLAFGLHLGKGPQKQRLYQLFQELDPTVLESTIKTWFAEHLEYFSRITTLSPKHAEHQG